MRRQISVTLLVLLVAILSSCAAQSAAARGARDEEGACVIMLPDKATLREWEGARELAGHMAAIYRTEFPVVNKKGLEIFMPDMLVNGSFELDPRIGWVASEPLGAFEWARGKGVGGSHAALLNDAKGGSARYMRTRNPVKVTPGVRYEVSVDISKKVASGTGRVALWWEDSGKGRLPTANLFLSPGSHGWKRYSKIVTAPPTAATVALAVAFDQAGPGEILVDNMRLRPLSSKGPETHDITRAIVIGSAVDRSMLGDAKALGRDGYVVRTKGKQLFIAGNTDRGTLNGVYSFLEEDLGVRWLTPGVTHLPTKIVLRLPKVHRRYVPPFESRMIYGVNAFDIDWAARHRLNTFIIRYRKWRIMSDKRTTDSRYYAVNQCHNYHNLLADGAGKTLKELYDEHPEYFPLLNGKRRFYPHRSQLCLSNPDVVRLTAEGVRKWAARSPGAAFLSISQEDVARFCTCDKCTALYKKHGFPGPGVSTVNHVFVNKVAELVDRDLPKTMRLSSLAYHFTQPCPTDIKMHPRVMVRYAPIRADFFRPFDQGDYNRVGGQTPFNQPYLVRIPEQMRRWTKMATPFYVWYYSLVLPVFHPHPNLRSLGRNFRIMRDAGVDGVFAEDISHVPDHAMGHLRAYLLAHLLWNPDYDVEGGMTEFCGLYFGAAGPTVENYLSLLHDENMYDLGGWDLWKRKPYLGEYRWFGGKPGENFMTPVFFIRYSKRPPLKREFIVNSLKMFDDALAAVSGDAELLRRVRVARMAVHFAGIENLPKDDALRAECIREFLPEARKAVAGDNKYPKWLAEYEKKIGAGK